jgi:hypothetical protein
MIQKDNKDFTVYLKLRLGGYSPASLQLFGTKRGKRVNGNCSLAPAKSGSLARLGRPHRPACYTRSEPSLRVPPDFGSLTKKTAPLVFTFLEVSSLDQKMVYSFATISVIHFSTNSRYKYNEDCNEAR